MTSCKAIRTLPAPPIPLVQAMPINSEWVVGLKPYTYIPTWGFNLNNRQNYATDPRTPIMAYAEMFGNRPGRNGWEREHVGAVEAFPPDRPSGWRENGCGRVHSTKVDAMIDLQESDYDREQRRMKIHYDQYRTRLNQTILEFVTNQKPTYWPQ